MYNVNNRTQGVRSIALIQLNDMHNIIGPPVHRWSLPPVVALNSKNVQKKLKC